MVYRIVTPIIIFIVFVFITVEEVRLSNKNDDEDKLRVTVSITWAIAGSLILGIASARTEWFIYGAIIGAVLPQLYWDL